MAELAYAEGLNPSGREVVRVRIPPRAPVFGTRFDLLSDLGRTSVGPRSDPATGKQRRHYKQGFRTKREAEAALDELLSVIRSGDVVN